MLVANEYFALERWSWVERSEAMLPASVGPQVLTILSGNVDIGSFQLATGESAVVWPGDSELTMVSNDAVVLRGWVPDISDIFPFKQVTS